MGKLQGRRSVSQLERYHKHQRSVTVDDFDDVIKDFLVVSYEGLDQLDRDLVALEDAPDDCDCLGSIFRSVHSMKGASGFLGLPKLERVAHVGENLLVPLRDGDLKFNHDIADGLLGMVDALRDILGNIESDGSEGTTDYEELSARLSALLTGDPALSESQGDRNAENLNEVEGSLTSHPRKTHADLQSILCFDRSPKFTVVKHSPSF